MATILIVDDCADIRTYLRTMLEGAGHIIVEAGSGQEALRAWNAPHPDLVITDHSMPGMSGVELIRALGQWQPGVKGILMSAGQDPRLAGSPNHSSAWPFLQKPFAFEGLRQVIDSLLLAQPSEPD